ncbi:MAG: metal-dependent transcriptional regulator [Deltaproteobacteria bacterium]|nr:metal-dependent transcriptional regulator [Deltaproteobacteria bacterium]MBW2154547.1 metal-dependent transcriptional regulator [Deltaproteobacteria bacterium]
MTDNQNLSSSMEDYLEAIFHIAAEKQAARVKDIATRLKVNNASVTGALRVLSDKGLINYTPYDIITLTPEGKIVAEDIVRRHETLKEFFIKILLVNETEAEDAACKMEHAVSKIILNRLIRFVEFVEICPRGGDEWLQGFHRHCESGKDTLATCASAISMCIDDLKKKEQKLKSAPQSIVLLDAMHAGQRGRISHIKTHGFLKKKFSDLGITTGSIVEVENLDPLNDKIGIKVRGYHLSINTQAAANIAVELFE